MYGYCIYNKGGTAIIRPLHFYVEGFFITLRNKKCTDEGKQEEKMSKKLEKTYNPKEIETKLYEKW